MTTPTLRLARAAVAVALLGSAAYVATSSAEVPVSGDVAVRGGGTLRGTWPPGTTAWRGPTKRSPTAYGEERAEPARTGGGAPAAETSATFPTDTAHDPGTIYTVAGGECEGFPALDATLRPYRIAYDRRGTLFFLDVSKRRGSPLIRYVDAAGRIRTLAPLHEPEEGRRGRGAFYADETVLVPDHRGGVYVNRNAGYQPTDRTAPPIEDVALSNDVVHIAADGTRTLVVGGVPLPSGIGVRSVGAGDGDPVERTALGLVQAFTVDDLGGVYLIDGGDILDDGRLRYANRTGEPRTFFPGTDDEVTVAPGEIRTIAGGFGLPTVGAGGLASGPVEQRASDVVFNVVPKLLLRGDVLYYANTRWDGMASFRSQPAVIAALNLFASGPVVVNGVPVSAGHARPIAGDPARTSGYSGDGGPAIAAQLALDHALVTGDFTVLAGGDLYISDSRNHRIRRVDGLGLITTVAGTGAKGPAPRSGTLALASPLWFPLGLDAHPAGGVAFADYSNARVRRLTPGGVLEHVAGRGPYPCGADGEYATGTGVYTGHALRSVTDVATDSQGRTYVADAGYKTIRRLGKDGRVELTIGRPQPCMASVLTSYEFPADVPFIGESCPNGSPPLTDMPLAAAVFAAPSYVLVDAYDNLFVSDLDAIRYVNLRPAPVPVLGKVVPPLSVVTLRTFGARQVHVDIGGDVIDDLLDQLPELPVGSPLPAIPRLRFDFTAPLGEMAIDTDGSLYVSDPLLNVVYRLGSCTELEVVAGNGRPSVRGDEGDGGTATDASLHPRGLALDRGTHVLYVVDQTGYNQARVRAVNRGTEPVRVLGRTVAPGRIQSVVGTGRCEGNLCSAGDGQPAYAAVVGATSLELRPDGGLVLAEEGSHRIRLVDPADARIYGILGPWPEGGGQTRKGFGDAPAGYLGDGGPALSAWTSGVGGHTWGAIDGRIATAVTPDDGLLVADGIGRVRRMDGVTNAPRRAGLPVLGVVRAGDGFSDTVVLDDGDSVGTGPARASLVELDGVTYVVAARGAGNGCFLWAIRTDADGAGRDAATPQGTIGPRSGISIGGRRCAIALAPDGLAALTTVRPRDSGSLAHDAALYAASSADGGTSWAGAPAGLPQRARATGDDAVALASRGSLVSAVYGGADGRLHVADSADGTAYAEVGSFAADHLLVGDYALAAGSRRVLGLVTRTVGVVDVAYSVEVAHSDDGASWRRSRVAPVTAVDRAGAPAVVVAPSGRVYASWSDGHDVWLAWSDDLRAWSAPVRVPGGSVNANPGLAVDAAGTVVVGYVGTPMPRIGDVTNPYAQWYAYVAVARPGRPLTSYIASDAPVHEGALCYRVSCQGTYYTTAPVDEANETYRELGPARVLLRPNGDLHLVVAMTADTGRNRSTTRAAVGHLRACRDLGLHREGAPSRCAPATGGESARPPLPVPVPTAPPVPVVTPCTEAPPPFQEPAPPAAPPPAEEPPPDSGEPPRNVGVLVPFLPVPPLLPALPPAQAPAQGVQNAQQLQQNTQQQGNGQGQTGVATDEDEQAEMVTEYAFSRREPSPAVLLGAAGLFSAAAAAGARHRTRYRSAAP